MGNAFGPASQLDQQWELDTRLDPDNQRTYVTLRASNGKYLSATPHGTVSATADTSGDSEKWFLKNCLEDRGECCVSLMSFHGHYLTNACRFDCGKVVRADRNQIVTWSKWIIVDDPNAMTRYSAGGNVRMVGAVVTTLFLPIVLGAAFITMDQRSICYGGSREVFSVLLLDEQNERPQNSTAVAAAPELIWVPLKAVKNVSKQECITASSGAADSADSMVKNVKASSGAADSASWTSIT